MDWATAISFLVGLGGLITALATWRRSTIAAREAAAAAKRSDVEALAQTVDALLEENNRLRIRIREMEEKQRLDRSTIDTLRCQVEKLESENRWFREQQEELERENKRLKELMNVEGC